AVGESARPAGLVVWLAAPCPADQGLGPGDALSAEDHSIAAIRSNASALEGNRLRGVGQKGANCLLTKDKAGQHRGNHHFARPPRSAMRFWASAIRLVSVSCVVISR